MRKWYEKVILLVLTSMLLLSIPFETIAADKVPIAAFATDKPKIDGKIDSVWRKSSKMQGDHINDMYGTTLDMETYTGDLTSSYAQMLWSEEGLYFIGVVFDTTITEDDTNARNSVDFWVSEKNTKEMGYQGDGDWHYCIASDGTEYQYTGNHKIGDVAETAVKVYKNRYVVELFVPYQSEFQAKEGTVIAVNVSFNDDIDGDGVSDVCTYWNLNEESKVYWVNTSALAEVKLVKQVNKGSMSTMGIIGIGMLVVAIGIGIVGAVALFLAYKKRNRRQYCNEEKLGKGMFRRKCI